MLQQQKDCEKRLEVINLEINELDREKSLESHDCTALLDPQTATPSNSDNTGFKIHVLVLEMLVARLKLHCEC